MTVDGERAASEKTPSASGAALALIEREKQIAGEAAASVVQSGMKIGLGTGSTVYFTIETLGRMVKSGQLTDLITVATSERTATLARGLGMVASNLSDVLDLDLTIDGADEVDPQMHLIKGLGGALLREKIVASSSKRMLVVVDSHKLVKKLGTQAPVPVEVEPFAWRATQMKLAALAGCDAQLRITPDGNAFRTDGGHYIVDCHFKGGIDDPPTLERAIREIPGALECGLFVNLAKMVVVGTPERAMQMELGGALRPI